MSTEERQNQAGREPSAVIPLGMTLGTLIGVPVGVAIDDLPMAIAVGALFGVVLGGVAFAVLTAIRGRNERR